MSTLILILYFTSVLVCVVYVHCLQSLPKGLCLFKPLLITANCILYLLCSGVGD